jgi:hypothetical protein
VANGIWISTFSAWFLSVPMLTITLFCLQGLDGIISATHTNNWSEYSVLVVGILSMLWVNSTYATASCLLSTQCATYATSRDHVLPFGAFFRGFSKRKMAVNTVWLNYFILVAITCAVIGSTAAS